MRETILPTKKCKTEVWCAESRLLTVSRFSMARDADRAGRRTVGIITKCDAVQEGDEAGVSGLFTM
jgi:hypothetical protein